MEWLLTLKYALEESGRNMGTGFIWFGVAAVVSAVMSIWV
jgi:hypothetical protein